MKSLVESVKEGGVSQPALVRPREDGGYEIIAGHRRQKASELAGYANMPCIVRNMTDEEAVLAMVESNFNQRAEILPSERAKSLEMQLGAIKRQGARFEGVASGDVGKRSNEVIAERNKMAVKQVQRYIALNKLVPELMGLVDDKKIKFTPAVEMSYIKPKNQRYIASAMEAEQSAPSLSQAQRMRELDQKGQLTGDVIDGIMCEEKKEEIRVIINSQELEQYFGKEKTPQEMKGQILKLLDEWKEKNPQELSKPVKRHEQEK
jgi:ParB-like chromosome segregation protein Spo0J